ncbi:MAG TPA: methionine--tRNA ligase [Patescibacteria group bacterium]
MSYITTPIYYVNGDPHIGSAYTTLVADVFARYSKYKGEDTFFLTGTDEHGAKIAEAAAKAGKEPQAFTDEISAKFFAAWKELNIQPDGFIRTTNPKHKAYVQKFLQDLYDKGHIYKGEYKGWYCTGCEEFKTETQIGENNTCPIHLTPLNEVAEEAYLFKLSAFETQIKEALNADTFKVSPSSRKNEVLGFIEHEGLRDVAISRKNVAWGVPLPWDESHTVYVWVDALLNYLSAADVNGPEFKSGKRPEFPPTLQIIGKDILRFHALIWPAIILAADLPLPKELFVHGYFTSGGQKMSKSLGNVITPGELIGRYGVDATRWLLATAVPFGADGDLTLDRLDERFNSDLANNFGNLFSRVASMILRYREGRVPDGIEVPLLHIEKTRDFLDAAYESADLTKVTDTLRLHADNFNKYIEDEKPWALAKTDQKKLDEVLANLAENVFVLACFLAPFLPEATDKILAGFGTSVSQVDYATLGKANHTAGKTIPPLEPLFPRLAA